MVGTSKKQPNNHRLFLFIFFQLYPLLFDRVKEKVKSGHFHPIGGQWLESDGNMPSGEAFVRQFVFGQRYFQSRFGIRCGIYFSQYCGCVCDRTCIRNCVVT